tara:strand:+ start:132 stop:275 length:144 start_codon:yes stop_codon:yes gene_type:complete
MGYINIKPTTTFKEDEEKEFTLADKDFLLIEAIRNLSEEVLKLRCKL